MQRQQSLNKPTYMLSEQQKNYQMESLPRIYNFYFHKDISEAVINKLQNANLVKAFIQNHNSIMYQKYKDGNWDQIFSKYVKYSTCSKLSLLGILQPSIFKNISSVSWINMITISVNSCDIANIQQICYIDAPNIKYISLQKNKIYSIETFLKKSHFNHLQYVDISCNSISKVINLHRFWTSDGGFRFRFIKSSNQICIQIVSDICVKSKWMISQTCYKEYKQKQRDTIFDPNFKFDDENKTLIIQQKVIIKRWHIKPNLQLINLVNRNSRRNRNI